MLARGRTMTWARIILDYYRRRRALHRKTCGLLWQKKNPARAELCYEFPMPENSPYVVRGDDGVEYGPVGLTELREWVRENRAGLGTSVRPESDENGWQPWQHYPELVALLAEVRVTGTPAALPILAPLGRRMLAFFGDFVMSLLLIAPLTMLLYSLLPSDLLAGYWFYLQAASQGLTATNPVPIWFQVIGNAIVLLVPLAYYGGFHALLGRTPGKSLMQIQVVDAQGNKPRFDKALLRAFIYAVSVYYFYGIPLFYAFLNPQRRALHDIAAGTYVVES